MKNYGVVSGHCFSRSALENMKADLDKAIEEMNQPDPIKHLARVRSKMGLGLELTGVVLVGGSVQQGYLKGLQISGLLTVVDSRGGGHTYNTEHGFRAMWEVVE